MAVKNIEINIKNSNSTYDQLYPKSIDDNIFLSEDIISALNLNENATLKDALSKTSNSGVFLKEYNYNLYNEITLNFNNMTLGTDFRIPTTGGSAPSGINAGKFLSCRILQDSGNNWLVGITSLSTDDTFRMNSRTLSTRPCYATNTISVHNLYELNVYDFIHSSFRDLISNDSIETMGTNGRLTDYIPPYKIFLLSTYEMRFTMDKDDMSEDYFPLNEGSRITESYLSYLDSYLNGASSGYRYLVSRSFGKDNTGNYVVGVGSRNSTSRYFYTNSIKDSIIPYAFLIPKSTVYTYYTDNYGNYQESQKYDTYSVLCDALGNITNSVYLGSYVGTGESTSLTITCEFPMKMLILGNVPGDYYNAVPEYFIINPYTTTFYQTSGMTSVSLTWANNNKTVTLQNWWTLNQVGERYQFIAFG